MIITLLRTFLGLYANHKQSGVGLGIAWPTLSLSSHVEVHTGWNPCSLPELEVCGHALVPQSVAEIVETMKCASACKTHSSECLAHKGHLTVS